MCDQGIHRKQGAGSKLYQISMLQPSDGQSRLLRLCIYFLSLCIILHSPGQRDQQIHAFRACRDGGREGMGLPFRNGGGDVLAIPICESASQPTGQIPSFTPKSCSRSGSLNGVTINIGGQITLCLGVCPHAQQHL